MEVFTFAEWTEFWICIIVRKVMCCVWSHFQRRYRVVHMWIRLWAGQSGVRILAGTNILFFSQTSRLGLESTQSAILSMRVNWPGIEAVHSILFSIKIINEWNYNSPPTAYLDGVDRNSFLLLYCWVRTWNILDCLKTVTSVV